MMSKTFVLSAFLTFLLLLLLPLSEGIDTITLGMPISDDQEERLVSAGRRFVLGFFSRGTSRSQRYVGIWYYDDPLAVVWVANRENPLSDRTGVFGLDVNGDLGLTYEGKASLWSTRLRARNKTRTAKLMDSGNFVLSEEGRSEALWQSFNDPFDTFIPGMVMAGDDFKLTSWKGPDDPAPGDFTFQGGQDWDNQFIVQRKNSTSLFWKSGLSWMLVSDNVPSAISSLLKNSSLTTDQMREFTRLVVGFDGKIQYFTRTSGAKVWNLTWYEPKNTCHHFAFCGNFGICNIQKTPTCRCLPGFKPQEQVKWDAGDFSRGCRRTSDVCGEVTNITAFQSLKLTKVVKPITYSDATDPIQCEADCLSDCNCQAYSYTKNQSAPKGKCWIWSEEFSNIQEDKESGLDVYVRVSTDSSGKGKPRYIIYPVVALVLGIAVGALLYMRKKLVRKRANPAFPLYDSKRQIKEWITSSRFTEDNKEGINVPFFDMEIILEATNYFSDHNKLGKGGFGLVYKGTLPGGQEIAVKRLSSDSGQGFEQFKNEVLLISKLQHRNLVRLLGYCTQGDEKLLVYEYMPNKSLDSFIFDRTRSSLLSWQMRMEIISGIARGMLYLHHDSRLRVVHRDLKVSNVLLDEDMNPKISDFGLARIFEAKQTEARTNRVIGTFGYMSPEYALDGFFSVKSDVFSFGVVVLEIISGKRNTGFYQSKVASSLLSYAWRLWNEDNAIGLVDPTLQGSCNRVEASKCIKLALLCLQIDPGDRPTMSNVVFTLSNENVILPTPKRPGFVVERDSSSCEASTSGGSETSFEISHSLEQGR